MHFEVVYTAGDPVTLYGNEMYKKRVERFVRENKHHITISKLNTNQTITQEELLELQRILFDGVERGKLVDF